MSTDAGRGRSLRALLFLCPLLPLRALLLLLVLLHAGSAFAADPAARLSCVGDSITAGYGLDDQTTHWLSTRT